MPMRLVAVSSERPRPKSRGSKRKRKLWAANVLELAKLKTIWRSNRTHGLKPWLFTNILSCKKSLLSNVNEHLNQRMFLRLNKTIMQSAAAGLRISTKELSRKFDGQASSAATRARTDTICRDAWLSAKQFWIVNCTIIDLFVKTFFFSHKIAQNNGIFNCKRFLIGARTYELEKHSKLHVSCADERDCINSRYRVIGVGSSFVLMHRSHTLCNILIHLDSSVCTWSIHAILDLHASHRTASRAHVLLKG